MNILKTSVLIVVIGIALCAAAAVPVAVRVEIEPLAVGADGTSVVLTVQISPEDRSRIGKNAMVRVMLDGDVPRGQSPLWAVRIESDGSGQIETVWPPGEHALQVEISSPSGEHTGLWVGTVIIPGAKTAADNSNAEPPAPEQMAVPEPEEDDLLAAAGTAIVGDSAVPPVVDEPVEISESVEEIMTEHQVLMVDENPKVEQTLESIPEPEIQVEADVVPDIELPPEPAPIELAIENEVEPLPSVPDEMAVGDEAMVSASDDTIEDSAAVAGAVGMVAATAPAPETMVEAPAEPESAVVDQQVPMPDAGGVEPEVAIVEPLRAEGPQSGADSGPAIVAAPEAPEQEPEPPPAEVAAALEAWADVDPLTADLTVVAFRGDEPATGLEPSQFNLKVGGKNAMIEEVGGRDRAPLQLGVAVDVATSSGAGWSQSGGRLFPLVQRARGGRGHVFFATDGRVGAWDGGPGQSREEAGSLTFGGLTSLIVESLGRFEGRRGRTFLVVVTDGRTDADKAAWKAATEAAANSGVPVLVIVLWDDKFSHRIRKNLKTIADSSGGSLFLVQGSDQLDRAAERFGPMIDAGVALRFVVPPGVVFPASVSIAAADKELEVAAPKGVR